MEATTPKKTNLNKTWLLVAGLVILTIVLLAVSLTSKVNSPTPSRTKEVKTDFAHTSLSISNSVRLSALPGTYEVDVMIDTKNDKVIGTQLELSYDPKVLTKVDVKAGPFFNSPVTVIKKIDTSTGRITYAVANKRDEKAVSGSGVIATIIFSKSGNAETSISFLPQSQVGASGITNSVLKETSSAVIGILPQTGNATPLVSPALYQNPSQ